MFPPTEWSVCDVSFDEIIELLTRSVNSGSLMC